MSEKKTCCAEYMDGYHLRRCRNTAKIVRDSKWYCGVHDPEKRQQRMEALNAKIEREYVLRRLNTDLLSAERAVIEAAKKWLAHDTEDVGSFFGVMAELQRATTSLVNAEEALRVFKEGEGGN